MVDSYSSFKTQALLSLWPLLILQRELLLPFPEPHVPVSTTAHVTIQSTSFVFLSAPWHHELLWGEGIRLLSLSITSTVFDTQKELSKVGKRESKKTFHCFGERQRCCELWGATEDGAEEAYGVVSPPIPRCRFHRIASLGDRDASACTNYALKGSSLQRTTWD